MKKYNYYINNKKTFLFSINVLNVLMILIYQIYLKIRLLNNEKY